MSYPSRGGLVWEQNGELLRLAEAALDALVTVDTISATNKTLRAAEPLL